MHRSRSFKEYAFIAAKGACMGAADIVPGVSGGTIAFITGIYDELLDSIKQINPAALLVLKNQGIKAAWNHVNGNFLLALMAGLIVSIVTFARIVSYLLATYPTFVWAFFTGLILASIVLLIKSLPQIRLSLLPTFLSGAAVVLFISLADIPAVPVTNLSLFFGGFIAISAMILPGISGSFILLLIGLYPAALAAINHVDVPALGSFLFGCVCGLMIFSRFLSWLLLRFRSSTLATLIGFLVGSLYVTWPWKIPLKTLIDRHGEVIVLRSKSVLPETFTAELGLQPHVFYVSTFLAAGIFLVLFSEFLAKKIIKSPS